MSYKITNNNSTMADNCIKNYIKYKYRKDSKKMEIEKTVDWEWNNTKELMFNFVVDSKFYYY